MSHQYERPSPSPASNPAMANALITQALDTQSARESPSSTLLSAQPAALRRQPPVDRRRIRPDRRAETLRRRRGMSAASVAMVEPKRERTFNGPEEWLDHQEQAIREALAVPGAWEWGNREPAMRVVDDMLGTARTAHKDGMISDERLLRAGDWGLSILEGYGQGIAKRPDGALNARGWLGFEKTADSLAGLFVQLEPTRPATEAEDASRVSTLLKFQGNNREWVFNNFVNKHVGALGDTGPGRLSPANELWQQPEFLGLMGRRAKRNVDAWGSDTQSWTSGELRLWHKAFRAFGFDNKEKKKLETAWNAPKRKQDLEFTKREQFCGDNIQNAFAVMADLMKAGPTVPRDIHRRFKTRNFDRYHAQTLHDQLKIVRGEVAVPPGPLTLVLSPLEGDSAFKTFPGEIRTPEPTIYMEGNSLYEISSAMVETVKTVGRPIDGLVKADHGGVSVLGQEHDSPTVTSQQLLWSRGFARMVEKGILASDASIILVACHAGAPVNWSLKAVIQEIHPGMDVEAPSSQIWSSRVEYDANHPNGYKVQFFDNEDRPVV